MRSDLLRRLDKVEAKLPQPTSQADEQMSDEEFTKLVHHLLIRNVLRFAADGHIVGGSAYGEDYSGLADRLNEYLADNPEMTPIFPLRPDEARQALAALDAGHMRVSEIYLGDGRLACKQISQQWHGPNLGDLPYAVDSAIKVLNRQLIEPIELTLENVKELCQMRIEAG